MPILDTRPKDAKRRMDQPRVISDDEDGSQSPAKKRRLESSTSGPISVHGWLHPQAPPLIIARSPPLHSSSSTFLSLSISFTAPIHVVSETALAKEARRVVRELDVPSLVGPELLNSDDGAFQDGNGRSGKKGKERIREPDHRMWAVRTLCLKERRDGTAGEDDYQVCDMQLTCGTIKLDTDLQLIESYNDDGEKFGGERVMRALREGQAVDVLTICCRWYGGDMIGVSPSLSAYHCCSVLILLQPIRFQHIGMTANTSCTELKKLVILTDLRTQLSALDDEITALRNTINPPGSPLREIGDTTDPITPATFTTKYDDITDAARLGRLVKAKEKTKQSLESKAGWAALDQSKAEDAAAEAALNGRA
jgi:hypothetical protein